MRSLIIATTNLLVILCIHSTNAFVVTDISISRKNAIIGSHVHRSLVHLKASSKDGDDDEILSSTEEEEEQTILELPASGSSSYSGTPIESLSSSSSSLSMNNNIFGSNNNSDSTKPFVASKKFQLQYTCKICDTRNTHMVSRLAYREGVVVAVCKGCMSKHLIADNLNWNIGFDSPGGENNIEEYMMNRGLSDEVSRVSKDVFDLEKILHHKEEKNEENATNDNDEVGFD